MTIDENYTERLVNAVAKTLVEALETLTIEDVNMYRLGYTKAIDDVMAKAKEIQEQQIKNLEQHPKRYGKQWAIYMNTHLGHIQVACKRLIAEQLKEGGVDG